MTGTVELDQDGTHLLIRFPYREDLVAIVKDLPGRRWDPKGKVWRVPAAHVELVYGALSRHLFDFAPEIPSLMAGTLGTAKRAEPAPPRSAPRSLPAAIPGGSARTSDSPDAPPALSISQLNTVVRDGVRQLFPEAFWVVGEIVDFDKSAGRQHRFFQLIEKARGEARPLAAVEVALFAGAAERLLPALERHEPPLSLRDGIEVRVLVKLDLYVASGRYQIVVQDIDPSFTLGKLALSREQILRELAQSGLAARNRSLGFPVPALRIGVLTSADADGWNDLLRHLQESGCGFLVTLFPIKVQGIDLKPTLLAGLQWFARHEALFDVLCIVRGGGSRTDLAWFDDRDVAFAVAKHPLKVLVGIGHQRDQSVLDAIAHSEKTPTAIAELLVRGIEAAREDVHDRARRLADAVADRLVLEREHLARRAVDVHRATAHRLAQARAQLARSGRDLQGAVQLRLQRERSALLSAAVAARHGAERRIDRATARLDQQPVRLRLLDPPRVFARGFAVLRDELGRVVPSAARLQTDQTLRVQLRDGHADTRVTHVHRDQP